MLATFVAANPIQVKAGVTVDLDLSVRGPLADLLQRRDRRNHIPTQNDQASDKSAQTSTPAACDEMPLLVSIELPCFVSSPERALTFIGGRERFAKHMENLGVINNNVDNTAGSVASMMMAQPAPLILKYTGNPAQAGVDSNSSRCAGILVKMKRTVRRRKQPLDSCEEDDIMVTKQSAEVVGYVNKKTEFRKPFGCQIIPQRREEPTLESIAALEHSLAARNVSESKNCPADAILEIVPLNFFMSRVAVHEKFVPFYNDSEILREIKLARDQKSKYKPRKCDSIKFGDPIPPASTAEFVEALREGKSNRGTVVYEKVELLQKIFNEHEVWNQRQLRQHPELTPYQIIWYYPMVAFYYSTGPYSYEIVRRGVDVAQHPHTRIYQRIFVEIAEAKLERLRERVTAHIGKDIKNVIVDLDACAIRPKEQEASTGGMSAGGVAGIGEDAQVIIQAINGAVLKLKTILMVCDYFSDTFAAEFGSWKYRPAIDDIEGWLLPWDYLRIKNIIRTQMFVLAERFLATDPVALREAYFKNYPNGVISVDADLARRKHNWEQTVRWRGIYRSQLQDYVADEQDLAESIQQARAEHLAVQREQRAKLNKSRKLQVCDEEQPKPVRETIQVVAPGGGERDMISRRGHPPSSAKIASAAGGKAGSKSKAKKVASVSVSISKRPKVARATVSSSSSSSVAVARNAVAGDVVHFDGTPIPAHPTASGHFSMNVVDATSQFVTVGSSDATAAVDHFIASGDSGGELLDGDEMSMDGEDGGPDDLGVENNEGSSSGGEANDIDDDEDDEGEVFIETSHLNNINDDNLGHPSRREYQAAMSIFDERNPMRGQAVEQLQSIQGFDVFDDDDDDEEHDVHSVYDAELADY